MKKVRVIMHKLIIALLIFFTPGLLYGEIVTDLNGFRLLQYRTAAEAAYGKPDQVINNENTTYNVYYISGQAYMVFGHLNDKEHNIYSIQITGHSREMSPFKGLILGDSVEQVSQALGKPLSISKLEEPKVDVYEYENSNYSVEIDEDGKLYSIRINIENELFDNTSLSDNHWEKFKEAVLKKDNKEILSWLRPDVEIYKDGKIISIDKKLSQFNDDPDQTFIQAITADENSVYAELRKTEPESEMRIAEKMGVGSVFKFYKGTIIREIVFYPYHGRYRVYEIAFRED